MTWLLPIAMSNLLVALVFAACALLATRWARPALAHGLWLLFFIKLLTPPLFPITVTWALASEVDDAQAVQATIITPPIVDRVGEDKPVKTPPLPLSSEAEDAPVFTQEPELLVPTINQPPMRPANHGEQDAADDSTPLTWAMFCIGLWLAGSFAWFCLAGLRLACFRKQLRFAQAAPGDLQKEVGRLAALLNVSCPEVLLLPGPVSPMLWVFGRRPLLLVPAGLLERLDEAQRQAVLAHELAHWKRRDHWVRWLELAALTLYWWCPLVWWARARLQETEEECCDAWVVWLLPGAARGYALALLETVEFMSSARILLPPVASGIGHVRLLKRRLTMIMRGTTPRALTLSGGLALLGLAALLLPLIPTWAQSPGRPGQEGQVPEARAREQLQALDQAQQEIRRMQSDIERMQRDLQSKRAELERTARELTQKMGQLRRAAADADRNAERKGVAPQAGQNNPNNPFGGTGNFGPAMGSGAAGMPYMVGGMGTKGNLADVEKRLKQVEKKIDILIQLMRKDGSRSGRTPSTQSPDAATGGALNALPAPPTPRRTSGGLPGAAPPVAPATPTLPVDPSVPPAAPGGDALPSLRSSNGNPGR